MSDPNTLKTLEKYKTAADGISLRNLLVLRERILRAKELGENLDHFIKNDPVIMSIYEIVDQPHSEREIIWYDVEKDEIYFGKGSNKKRAAL